MIIKILLVSFAITLLTELLCGWLWGIRSRNGMFVICLVNLMTNPPLVMGKICCSLLLPGETAGNVILAAEVLICLLEGFAYQKRLGDCRHPYWFAAAANGLSYGIGLLWKY